MSHRGRLNYKVFLTPLAQADGSVYADEIDISDRITINGISSIRRSIDSSDYNIGVFVFNDLELTGLNKDGYFNENDRRSIFPSLRDRAKVRIEFQKSTMVKNSEGTVLSEIEENTVTFRGLINDEATRADFDTSKIKFKVLSRDSVLRTTKIAAGVVGNDDFASVAIFSILNTPRITSVLNLDQANITVDFDVTIDDGEAFNNKSVKESLDKLLIVTNSVLVINDAGDILVKSREANEDTDVLRLFGPFDVHKRENIFSVKDFNLGTQRNFTSIIVNGQESSSDTYVEAYGLRQKSFTFDFITDTTTAAEIALRLISEFQIPKLELQLTVPTDQVKNVDLLDRVSVSYPLRIEPAPNSFLPVYGITKYGDTDQPYPLTFGSASIMPNVKFKVIEIEHQPEKRQSVLKLRQAGTRIEDGYFNTPDSNLYGFGIYGRGEYGTGDPAETWNPSVYGAGEYGFTRYE